MADRFNLEVVVNQPIDILKCTVTSFAISTTWYSLISVPLVHRSEALEAFQFINIPWFFQGNSVQWDIQPGEVASKAELYPCIENVFIPLKDLYKRCEKFNQHFLCHSRINHSPTCQVSLLYHHTYKCQLRKADQRIRYDFGPFNFLFFPISTEALVKCPNKHFNIQFYGLINFQEIRKCKIITKTFTLLPQSTAISMSTFINKTNAITVIKTELSKVSIKFNEQQHPFFRIETSAVPKNDTNDEDNSEQGVNLFGHYTVLVNSITLLILLTIMVVVLCICMGNFYKHIREQLYVACSKL